MAADDKLNYMDEEFANYAESVSCLNLLSFPYADRCEFVKKTPECVEEMRLLTYTMILSCEIGVKNKFEECVFISVCVALCFEFLLMLAYIADVYYSPALRTISRHLHMNEHLAGVTILAFGNTSPDVFANLAELKGTRAVFANSMASSLFVTMLTGGVVCFLSPFRMNAHSTVRDILFIMMGVLLMEFLLVDDDEADISECIAMIMLYVLYIGVNMIDLYLMRRSIKTIQIEMEELMYEPETVETQMKWKRYQRNLSEMLNDVDVKETIDPELTRNAHYDPNNSKNDNLFRDAWHVLKPFKMKEWHESSTVWRSILLAKAPVVVLCGLLIPLTNKEHDKHGWCKLLNCIQVVITPSLIVMVGMGYIDRSCSVWHLELQFAYTPYLIPLFPLAALVFWHSRTDTPPSYHWIFSYISVAGSMFLLYVCATEIDKIFDLIGTVLDISEHFMNATVCCACNCLGDLVTNAVLAMQGYEKMAYAASMGGPFFNILIVTGATFISRIYLGLENKWESQLGEYGLNCLVFLILGLFTTLIWTSVLNFRARRSMGIFNMCIYFLFLLFSTLAENGIIHSYRKDHFISIQ
ncbi:mitochondrial sodium/calcium exchanger protein-like [Scaptodrosophila lebanonensis]|uniref:Mitochondrial sodium/calcium exchanger protein-like n=1 Tax=Drosophila lebanonensis TaxID=7225 RepID=A0A6J2UKX4_DROLE|nr:mitochondrial sodium/calcium exchanger protein-like [Scaptodrosophila lebanonensis]